jgi:hypothetical protein
MPQWAKLTKREGDAVYVNLDNAVSIQWSEREKGSIITFLSRDGFTVQENPEKILNNR